MEAEEPLWDPDEEPEELLEPEEEEPDEPLLLPEDDGEPDDLLDEPEDAKADDIVKKIIKIVLDIMLDFRSFASKLSYAVVLPCVDIGYFELRFFE